ncbi:MAG: hypothetical protein F6K42_03430, partial [Leptolyngbya sp. SIO1D8]|nr:hypothetical protein [Leptolyngbya sp. SIO1D8]
MNFALFKLLDLKVFSLLSVLLTLGTFPAIAQAQVKEPESKNQLPVEATLTHFETLLAQAIYQPEADKPEIEESIVEEPGASAASE